MRSPSAMLAISAVTLLTACETTGDPRQGGLFGWSEEKAKTREQERAAHVTAAERSLKNEQVRAGALRSREAQTAAHLRTDSARLRAAEQAVQDQLAQTLRQAADLERDSPTAATASRARRLRASAEFVGSDTALSPGERTRRLRRLEAQIEGARRQLSQ